MHPSQETWQQQCAVPVGMVDHFGRTAAYHYLVSEKLLTFADTAGSHPGFAQQLPKFVTEIREIFTPDDIFAGFRHVEQLLLQRLRRRAKQGFAVLGQVGRRGPSSGGHSAEGDRPRDGVTSTIADEGSNLNCPLVQQLMMGRLLTGRFWAALVEMGAVASAKTPSTGGGRNSAIQPPLTALYKLC